MLYLNRRLEARLPVEKLGCKREGITQLGLFARTFPNLLSRPPTHHLSLLHEFPYVETFQEALGQVFVKSFPWWKDTKRLFSGRAQSFILLIPKATFFQWFLLKDKRIVTPQHIFYLFFFTFSTQHKKYWIAQVWILESFICLAFDVYVKCHLEYEKHYFS